MSIQIEHLEKHFGDFAALKDINLTVPTGSLTALLGPSGCGKTTLLRIIAGLDQADSGHILFDGKNVTHEHVRDRKVGFMFQHYALFRHMNVFDNVAFGLQVLPRSQRPSKAQIAERVQELLKLVQLDWLAKAIRNNFRVASDSVLRWRGRWRQSLSYCCSMSHLGRWMPRCAKNCANGCVKSITPWASPVFW